MSDTERIYTEDELRDSWDHLNEFLASGDLTSFERILAEDGINLHKALRAAQAEIQRLRDEYASYRDTAEEISQCYNDSHSDSWVFEEALRRIANKSLEDRHNVGFPDADKQQEIALHALEKVWKRRTERAYPHPQEAR